MPDVPITDDEVIALGKKLDQFGEVLTSKEQLMLYAMIKAAGKEFLSSATPTTPANPPPGQTPRPKLSSAFDAAYIPGRAAEFANQTELDIGPVHISGSVTASVK